MSRLNLPFCELHVHIEGTLEPSTIFQLARRQGLRLPYADEAELARLYEFDGLQSFLDLYYQNMVVLQSEGDFFELAAAYFKRAHRAGVKHAELFVDPQAHSKRGIPERVVLTGIQRAVQEVAVPLGISTGIIVCVLRDQPVTSAERMLDAVLESGVEILGIGLDSAEVGNPPRLFQNVFERAAAAGLHRVAHAGEEGPAQYIWEAIDILGVERIDHGNRALEDPALIARLVRDRTPLTLCPFSNVRLRVVPTLDDVPLRRMLDEGLIVTLNSDDPAYFGGYIDDNIAAVTAAFGLTAGELSLLARNSVMASFADSHRKTQLLEMTGF